MRSLWKPLARRNWPFTLPRSGRCSGRSLSRAVARGPWTKAAPRLIGGGEKPHLPQLPASLRGPPRAPEIEQIQSTYHWRRDIREQA